LDCQVGTWVTLLVIDLFPSNSMFSLPNEPCKFECRGVHNPYPLPSSTYCLKSRVYMYSCRFMLWISKILWVISCPKISIFDYWNTSLLLRFEFILKHFSLLEYAYPLQVSPLFLTFMSSVITPHWCYNLQLPFLHVHGILSSMAQTLFMDLYPLLDPIAFASFL